MPMSRILLYKMVFAGALWMLAVMLMVIPTTENGPDVLRGWALLTALVAWIPTQALLLDHERHLLEEATERMLHEERRRTERLMQALAVEFAESEVPRIGQGKSS